MAGAYEKPSALILKFMVKIFKIAVLFSLVLSFARCRQETLFRGRAQPVEQHKLGSTVTGDPQARAGNAVSATNDLSVEVDAPADDPLIKNDLDISLKFPNAQTHPNYKIKYTLDGPRELGKLYDVIDDQSEVPWDSLVSFGIQGGYSKFRYHIDRSTAACSRCLGPVKKIFPAGQYTLTIVVVNMLDHTKFTEEVSFRVSRFPRIEQASLIYAHFISRTIFLNLSLQNGSYPITSVKYLIDHCNGKGLKGVSYIDPSSYSRDPYDTFIYADNIYRLYGSHKTYMKHCGCSTGTHPARGTFVAVDSKGNESKPVVVYMTRN